MGEPSWMQEALGRMNEVGTPSGPGDMRSLNIQMALAREDEKEVWRVQGAEFTRQQIMDAIITFVYGGATLRRVCALDGMPSIGTVLRWRDSYASFGTQLLKAQRAMATVHAEDVVNLSEDAHPSNARLVKVQVEAKKWLASKYDDRFAEKQRIEMGSLEGLTRAELEEQLGMLLLNASGNLVAQIEGVIKARGAKPVLTVDAETQEVEVEGRDPMEDFHG